MTCVGIHFLADLRRVVRADLIARQRFSGLFVVMFMRCVLRLAMAPPTVTPLTPRLIAMAPRTAAMLTARLIAMAPIAGRVGSVGLGAVAACFGGYFCDFVKEI